MPGNAAIVRRGYAPGSGGSTRSLFGVVLGQPTRQAVFDSSRTIVSYVAANVQSIRVMSQNQVVGKSPGCADFEGLIRHGFRPAMNKCPFYGARAPRAIGVMGWRAG